MGFEPATVCVYAWFLMCVYVLRSILTVTIVGLSSLIMQLLELGLAQGLLLMQLMGQSLDDLLLTLALGNELQLSGILIRVHR